MFNSLQNFITLDLTKRLYNRTATGEEDSSTCIRYAGHLTTRSFFLFPVTPLQARTFAAWTLVSAVVRFYAAYNINSKP